MTYPNPTTTSHVWVCLCGPSDLRNVAGAIRAVANFGLAGVKLVTESAELTDPEALYKLSSGASAVVELLVFETLEAALHDATIVVGTTRRRRAHAHLRELRSHELTSALHDHERPHILFGNERVGLSHAELDLCHATVELHSQPSFPSLNLAHAVACVAYELARPSEAPLAQRPELDSQLAHPSPAHSLPTPKTFAREDEAFLRRVMEVSERTSYPPGRSPERFARRLRALLRRAQATPGDYGMILGLIREIDCLSASGDQTDDQADESPLLASLPHSHELEPDDV